MKKIDITGMFSKLKLKDMIRMKTVDEMIDKVIDEEIKDNPILHQCYISKTDKIDYLKNINKVKF